ncbi:MAG: hypothetical protein BWK73_39700 [Thiothrix lacustris]|uniref:TIR domain-containing protein n=1 Tax=Thiothrix lacustris TaxID=525917 RepID=A0A1Y1QE13_9GAMM|nr:MAG: hypothetical protein BWK73_39700 [Thiothrix lacustris]
MPDLFLSYAHVDKHWVDTFAALLEQRVNQYVGRAKPDRLWKDNRFSGNTAISPEIDAQLAQAHCLVSFISPGYLASEWCIYELATFSTRVGANSGRIFCVELDHIPPEHKPAAVAPILGYRFWWQDTQSKRTYPLTASQPDFENRLIDLAKDITVMLQKESPAPTIANAPPSSTSLDKGRPGGVSSPTRRNLLQTKLERLQAQYDLETRVEEQMRMEKLIADIQATLQHL